MINKILYNYYFLSRSGSHAIRDWLYCQFGYTDRKDGYHHSILIGKDFNIMIENYERGHIFDKHKKLFSKNRRKVLNDDRKDRDKRAIIILRDPFNLFASWSRHRIVKKFDKKKIDIFVDIWKEHAKEFLGDTNYYNKKICIEYNQWFINKGYRKNICEQMGLKFTDRGKNKLSLSGFGSSFNGRNKKFLKNADKLDTLNRWKIFLEDNENNNYKKKFLPIFKDKELINLSKRIFGNIEGTEKLYE